MMDGEDKTDMMDGEDKTDMMDGEDKTDMMDGEDKTDMMDGEDKTDMMDGEDKTDMMDGEDKTNEEGGGCLIATAAFGSELSPQVQQLRDLRDNTVLATASGTAFMSGFNQLYYTFSPTVADLERENPAFKNAVRVALTPMLSSLALLNHVNIDTESEMIGYGVSIIMLNLGMYVGAPALAIILGTKMIRTRLHTEKSQNR